MSNIHENGSPVGVSLIVSSVEVQVPFETLMGNRGSGTVSVKLLPVNTRVTIAPCEATSALRLEFVALTNSALAARHVPSKPWAAGLGLEAAAGPGLGLVGPAVGLGLLGLLPQPDSIASTTRNTATAVIHIARCAQ